MRPKALLVAVLFATILFATAMAAQQPPADAPALTIYNQDFAVVRQHIALELKPGVNSLRFTGITAHLEPDSVLLRDPSGKRMLQVLEQNYQADPVSQQSLLDLFEGKTIDFQVVRGDKTETVAGRIVRSGSQYMVRRVGQNVQQYYNPYTGQNTMAEQPLIEVEGKLRFGLPGVPLFPALPQDTNLKPTLDWVLQTDRGGPLDGELSYVTGGMTWEADYNVVAPETGDMLDLNGWVTIDNQTGKAFENARVKLMAGDVNKIAPNGMYDRVQVMARAGAVMGGLAGGPPVTEKAFDEYHLYTLERTTTLRDRETKQVEFIHATGIPAKRIYVYDGGRIDPARLQQNWEYLRQQRDLGTESNPKVWVMQDFKNTQQNHLGMPLPKGRMRFYRRDETGALQFVGENTIDHTPRDENIRVYTGNAFDLTGSRKRTNFRIDNQAAWIDESFEVKVRNHKKEPVEVVIVEHFYRASGWDIPSSSTKFEKKDSHTAEFPVQIQADGEQTVIYSVHYSW